MSTIITRSGKGSRLTHQELDDNFTNLNTDKIEATTADTLTNKTIDTANNTITVVEADISDLGSYITDISAENIDDLSNVNITSVADGEILVYSSTNAQWQNATNTGGLTELSDDTTPQLGGPLDVNGNIIRNVSGTHVTIDDGLAVEGSVRYYDGGGNYYVGLRASNTTHTSYDLILPLDDGNNGQVLTTDGTGILSWSTPFSNVVEDTTPQLGGDLDAQSNSINNLVDPVLAQDAATKAYVDSSVSGASVTSTTKTILEVRNTTGSAIAKGVPVYVSGHSGTKILVAPADANDPTKMPAIGLMDATLANNSDGEVISYGLIIGIDLSTFSIGDTLYIDTTPGGTSFGGLTNIAPTGETSLIQNIGRVARNVSNGEFIVTGPGRTNATPNLDEDQFFLGNSSNQSVAVDFSDAVGNTTATLTNKSGNISQWTNDTGYLTAETNDLTSAVTWANVPDANITQSSVTQHQAALSITESQISDLAHYADSDVDTHLNTSTATTGQVLSWDGVDYDWITGGAGGGISNVVEDTTPQLGGMLDVNGNSIGDGTLELLKFTETASAVNEITIANSATGSGPVISATGDDTNIDITFASKGNGLFRIGAAANHTKITSPGLYNLTLGTNSFSNSSTITINSNANGNNIVLDTNGTGDIVMGNYTFDGDQTVGATEDNYVMTYDHATGKISLEASAGGGGGGGDVVDDTTPQLGGDLDVNGNSIISALGSNGDIELAPDGTGNIKVTMASSNAIATDADNTGRGTHYVIGSPTLNTGFYGSNTTSPAFINWRNRSLDASAGRYYVESIGRDIKFNNANSTISGSNARFRTNHMQYAIDVNGMTYNDGNRAGRGIMGIRNNFNITNSNETYGATVERAAAMENQLYMQAGYDNEYSPVSNPQDLTIDHGSVYAARVGVERQWPATVNITGDISVWHTHQDSSDASGNQFNVSSGALFYNVKNDMPHYVEKFGSVGYYSELSYEATHSASGTYTLDYANGNTQIVTLGANITSFTMSNFPGDNNASGTPMIGSVTLFLKQDGTGSRTVSFTAGAGETFKIANGITTVDSGAGNYTVVSVMHVDGTYLWTISGNYI